MTKLRNIEQLFKSDYPAMIALAVRIIHDKDAARDIVHDVFATVLSKEPDDVTALYLMVAVRNGCLNYMRDFSTRERINELYKFHTAVDDADVLWPDEDTYQRIQMIIDSELGEQCRKVVRLRFYEGLSYMDIAGRLSISKVAVYKHLRHALDVLRIKINDYE